MFGSVAQARVSPRIEQIERARRYALRTWEDDYRIIRAELGEPETAPLDYAGRIWDKLAARLPYLREKFDLTHGTEELVRRPLGVFRKGGDCDDFVILIGGIIATRWNASYVSSVYMPNHLRPLHVVCMIEEHGVRMCFDLAPPATRGVWDGRGYRVPWLQE